MYDRHRLVSCNELGACSPVKHFTRTCKQNLEIVQICNTRNYKMQDLSPKQQTFDEFQHNLIVVIFFWRSTNSLESKRTNNVPVRD